MKTFAGRYLFSWRTFMIVIGFCMTLPYQNCAPPEGKGVIVSGSSQAAGTMKANFDTTVRPILRTHCARCHAETVRPLHSSASIDVGFGDVMGFGLVDLESPANSRLYRRLAVDNHNCWNGDCQAASKAMLEALNTWKASNATSAPAPTPGTARYEGPEAVVPAGITEASPADETLSANATEMRFTMATLAQGPVTVSLRIERIDAYSYRIFWPSVRAPAGVQVTAKNLMIKLNGRLLNDGTYAIMDKTVSGAGPDTSVPLNPTSTMIVVMEQGPGSDRIQPSFGTFLSQ